MGRKERREKEVRYREKTWIKRARERERR